MKRVKNYTTRKQAMELVANIVREHLPLIPGGRGGADTVMEYLSDRVKAGGDYAGIEWERSFAIDCRLNVSFNHGKLEHEETRLVYHLDPRVEVNWSSTGRTPSEAMAAIALYEQVTELACLLEAMLGRLDIADIEEKNAEAR